jgi:hypothetical protein
MLTRLLSARPAAVELLATGLYLPYPEADSLVGGKLTLFIKKLRTLTALAVESIQLFGYFTLRIGVESVYPSMDILLSTFNSSEAIYFNSG